MTMEKTYADRHKDDQNEAEFHEFNKMQEPAGQSAMYMSDSKANILVNGGKPGKTLILKLIQSEACENWFQELFLRRSSGSGVKIPKQLVSLDEKYLKRCMELMQMNAGKGAAPCALSVKLGSLDSVYVSNYETVGGRSSLDMTNCAIDYPMATGTGDLKFCPEDDEIVGSIMESSSMMRILSSPLFQRLGLLDRNGRLGGTNLFEDKKGFASEYQSSPSRLTSSISCEPGNESLALRNQSYQSDNVPRTPISMSSEVSVLAEQCSPSSLSPSGSQGMLHFTWDSGIPRFTFTLDDQKEVYVANAWKVSEDKAMNYVYSFHLKATAPKLYDTSENEPDTIGKMKVSTVFSLSSCNSRILETEFVLVGTSDNHSREMHTLSRNHRRSRKLSRVMDVFKAGHSNKQRTPSLFGGSSAIPEDFSPEKGLERCYNLNSVRKPDLPEDDFLPNFELAAIVVKNHLQDENLQKEEFGGWGLKFLKKAATKPSVASSEVVSSSSGCCSRNVGSSTSMDIIVPAGPHGGPRTRNGGPTGLIERWRSGGKCDCGGWDIGCPLNILKAKPKIEEGSPSSDAQGDCKSFDIFTEGLSHGTTPPLKLVNIRDGLYFISFQPSYLSALQCFSIAVAIVHSQSSRLCPKYVQD